MSSDRLRLAVYESVPVSELCLLIRDYAEPTPYRFNDMNFLLRYGASGCVVGPDGRRLTSQNANAVFWHVFVSEIPVSIGCTSWSIEQQSMVSIAYGLTTSTTNKINDGRLKDEDDFVISYARKKDHNGYYKPNDESDVVIDDAVRKVWFDADASTRTVRVRWRSGGRRSRSVVWNRPHRFDDVRPCVMLTGDSSAVFESMPTDCPAEYDEVLIVVGFP